MTTLVAITAPRPREKWANSWRAFVVKPGALPHLIACGHEEPVRTAAAETCGRLDATRHPNEHVFNPVNYTIGTYIGGAIP